MPTESEVQLQLSNAVDLLETFRAFADGTLAPASGKLDVLEQSLEGLYTPAALGTAAARYRAGLSALVSPDTIQSFITPVVFDYGQLLGVRSGYAEVGRIMDAIYEHLHENSDTIQSRNITYDTSATAGVGNVGNGSMDRLTVDANGYDMEACHVETKLFRVRTDQNSGTYKHAEQFEHLGAAASPDSLLRASHGSGENARVFLRSRHSGIGDGGSKLNNASFSTYSATASPKFTGWTESAGGSNISQDTTNYYRTSPGSSTPASLKITGGGGTVTLKQTLASMPISQLNPDRPYYLSARINGAIGSASGGSVTIRLGSQSTTVAVASLSGWHDVKIGPGTGNWFQNFNEDSFDIEIEWSSSTSGYVLVDDVIFDEWSLVDGTYWFPRGGTTAWQVDDTLEFTDTGGAPSTGKIQWYLFVGGYGYLPSDATPTIADP